MAKEIFQRDSDDAKARLRRLFLIGSVKKALGLRLYEQESNHYPIIDMKVKDL